ncbi:M4 family metallopeptidase [Streptomyces sp. NPDC056669]|uniref:M4 family metallopeptidase n=1 Tax=Streptomyces sp. NPDC056669 TaxID=3345903 RepID=UPI0036C61C67
MTMPRAGMRRSAMVAGTAVAATALLATGLTTSAAGAAPASETGSQPAALTASARAEMLREANATKANIATSLGLGAKEKLVVTDVIKDVDGTTHTRYDRTYDGLPVLGGDLIVHQAKSGDIKSVTKATNATVKVASTTAGVAPSTAVKAAIKLAKADHTTGASADQAPRKVIWAATGKPVLAYETVVGGTQKDGTPSELHVITDAATGKKLYQYQDVKTFTGTGQHNGKVTPGPGTGTGTGTGTGQYNGKVPLGSVKSGSRWLLKDTARGGHQTYNAKHSTDQTKQGSPFYDADNVWGNGKPTIAQTAAVDAHYGAAMTWDYYKNVFGRNGIRGDGKAAYSRVHFGDQFGNAAWNDDCFCMTYGDGAGNKEPLTALDVVGHEMTHGVTSATAKLKYGEAAGLDEATSDIFSVGVEFYAKNAQDPGDYLLGDKIDFNGDGTPARYMDKPSKDGLSYDYWESGMGNVDPHATSGVGNHFFYLLSEGSGAKEIDGVKYDSPTKDGSTVKGIGRAKAEKIWYKALTTYMTSNTDYHAARKATLKAATDLYGADSAEYKGVDAAWAGVNVK